MPGVEKVRAAVARSTKHVSVGPLLDVQMSFRFAGTRASAPGQKRAEREGVVAISKATTITRHYTIPIQLQLQLQTRFITLHFTTLLTCITPHYSYNYKNITLRYTQVHSTPLHSTSLITLHCAQC